MNISDKMKNFVIKLKKFLLCEKDFKQNSEDSEMKIFSYIKQDDLDAIKSEIANGQNLEICDENGRTPLIYAAMHNRIKATEMLLEKGAKVNNHDNAGLAAIHYAIFDNNLEMLQLLQKFNANLDEKTSVNEFTSLMIAIDENNDEIIKFLLDNGANVHLQDQEGLTALIFSIINDSPENTALMLSYGVSPLLETKNGYNAFQYANAHQNENIIDLLNQHEVLEIHSNSEDEVETVAEEFEGCDEFFD